jgi:ABC-type glycerol-3-phosphate transport system permease component
MTRSLPAARSASRPVAQPRLGSRTRKRLADLGTYAVLLFGAIIMAGPFVWMIATAFKLPTDQFTRTLIPNPATLENFQTLWDKLPFTTLIFNSLKIAVLSTIGQLLTCSMAAFVFAVVRFRGREFLFVLLLATMLIPPQVTLIPNFILFRTLGILKYAPQLALWLPAFWGGAFGTFLLRQFFLTIPRDFAEAARVDGASLWQIFWSVYLPLAKPALAALAVFTFLWSWNDLLHPLIFLPADLDQTTLTVGLSLFQTQYAGKWTVMMAGALVSIIPVIVVFFFAQKQFIEGVAMSGVKK